MNNHLNNPDSGPVICACVLAAGKSSRFGSTKLVEPFRDKPLVQHALIAAGNACPGRVYLVVGHDSNSVTDASANLFDCRVMNDDFDNGIGSSIAAAAKACQTIADAVIVILADQVLVTESHLQDLIDAWSGNDDEIVSSSFDGINCPPVLFPKKAFPALCELRGDNGAKSILADRSFALTSIDCPPAGFDVDRPQDLQRFDQD